MPNKTLEKKLLLVVKLTDGCWVLLPKEAHEPKQSYKSEARGFLARMILRSPVHSLKVEAVDKLANMIGFRRPADIETLKSFQEDGVEWHPVVLRLDIYRFNSEFLTHIHARKKAAEVIPIAEHKYAEKLLSQLA